MGLGGGGGGILGVSNPFTGTSQSLEFMGGGTWAGWSGSVTATNGTNGTLFNFRAPGKGLKVTASFSVDASLMSSNKVAGIIVKIDGTIVYDQKIFWSSSTAQPDFDIFYFVIPGKSLINIENYTTDDDNVPMALTLVCEQIGG